MSVILSHKTVPVKFDSYDYRAICLFSACMIYALFGSPTPDSFGWPEAMMGFLLALSVGVGRARDALFQPIKKRFWKSAGQFYLIYGLTLPLAVGVVAGAEINTMIRDLAPFLFMFLPVFLLPLIRARPYYFRSTLIVIVLIGLLFSLRSLIMRNQTGCTFWCTDELLYLENMPTVLFTCLLLIGAGMQTMMKGLTLTNILIFMGLVLLSLLPIAAMVATLQRASLGAVGLYTILLLGYYIYTSPVRGLNVFIMGLVAVVLVNVSFTTIAGSLWEKTEKVGLNMRPQELEAVWRVVTADPFRFLFGIGWGGQFNSPAVGGLSVNFTHNFFSHALLKTGVIGLLCCCVYIGALLERLARVVMKRPVIGLALAAPILIDITLYASYKSLDFGLVLLMISGSLVYFRQSESLPSSRI